MLVIIKALPVVKIGPQATGILTKFPLIMGSVGLRMGLTGDIKRTY